MCETKLAARIQQIKQALSSSTRLDTLQELGLGWTYVEPDTYADQPLGYFLWELSWGGPADQFLFYHNGKRVWKIQYVVLDWDYREEVELTGKWFELLATVFNIILEGEA